MGTLLVAAGGGGDAIAAAALSALAPDEAVGIATMAWDRLIIDPLPGPRRAADFRALEKRQGWWQVTPHSRPIAPAGSTLPRLWRRAEKHATVQTLDPEIWKPYLRTLDWHPTEATALLVSATHGLRGTVEIRDAGPPVYLSTRSPTVLEVELTAVADINPLVSLLADTESLAEAESRAVQTMGATELETERTKAAKTKRSRVPAADVLMSLPEWKRRPGAATLTSSPIDALLKRSATSMCQP